MTSSISYQENETMDIYPNPCRDTVNIAWEKGERAPNQIRLFTLNGSLVKAKKLPKRPGQAISLQVSELPEGAYILRMEGEQVKDAEMLFILK